MKTNKHYEAGKFQWAFLLPKYWGIWIAISLLMIGAILPWSIQHRVANCLAKFAWKYLHSRRKTTLKNLMICFPEKDAESLYKDGQEVFFNTMLGVFEALNAWYCPKWYENRIHIHGIEHIKSAKGHGILLLGSHTTLLDAGGFISSRFFDLDVVYRPQNNPLLDMMIKYQLKSKHVFITKTL